jgi:DNA-binding SARP family transcriptional activator
VGIQVRILGNLEVEGPSGAIHFGSAKERGLLVLLALEVGRVVSTDRLLENLWENVPSGSQVGALRVLVSRIRRTLAQGGADDVIVTQPPGYLLSPNVRVDAVSFVGLVETGRRHLLDGSAEEASGILGEALALWRAPQLGEYPGETGRAERSRLEQLRLVALETRIDADLSRGRHLEVLGELEALTASNPFHERFWAQRIISLYRSGRQAEALRTYGEIRQALVEELGVDPSPSLRELESAVLAQDDSLLGPVVPASRDAASGSPDPTDPSPVQEVSDASWEVPLPSRLRARPTIGLIGRNPEIARITDAFKRVAAGDGREIVLVSGEAGIGKTTLVAEAARIAAESGACVLLGRCDEEMGAPYRPFTEALNAWVVNGPESLLVSHIETYGSELSSMVPALGRRFGDLPPSQSVDPDTQRYLLFGSVVGLMVRIATDRPVVLVLDDLQWADKASLQLLRHLIASSEPMSLLIVGTLRSSELSTAHPLSDTLAALWRETGVSRIELGGLDDTGVLAFMEAAAGHALDDAGTDLAHAVYRETDGNPFFVGEVLRQLTESGAVYQDSTGRWIATADLEAMILPDSLRQVIGSRVANLGESARQVLPLASVIGREFDLDVLARVTERSEEELLDVLDAAATVALVEEVSDALGRYSFSHALIQHTLYQDLGPTRRARAHRQVAEAIEAISGVDASERVAELAHHWFSATQSVEVSKAIG